MCFTCVTSTNLDYVTIKSRQMTNNFVFSPTRSNSSMSNPQGIGIPCIHCKHGTYFPETFEVAQWIWLVYEAFFKLTVKRKQWCVRERASAKQKVKDKS